MKLLVENMEEVIEESPSSSLSILYYCFDLAVSNIYCFIRELKAKIDFWSTIA